MGDPFLEALRGLVEGNNEITGAAFADWDGEPIALLPENRGEDLRLCAVYSGIAMRRLTASEGAAGRAPIDSVIMDGDRSVLVAMRVADEYQLVVTAHAKTPAAKLVWLARPAIAELEGNF